MADEIEDADGVDVPEELFVQLKQWYRRDQNHWSKWRKEAKEDYDFVSGEQWAPEDVQLLKESARPIITFNRIDPMIRSVTGEQINNAQMVTYVPREEGDAVPNEILTQASMWFRDQSDADDEESDAFWDMATCGIGVTDTRLDTDEDPMEPMPIVERVDPLEMLFDADCTRRNFQGARRVWRIRSTPMETAENLLPGVSKSDLHASWAHDFFVDPVDDNDNDGANSYDDGDPASEKFSKRKNVTLVQVQWWEKEITDYLTLDPETGEMIKIPKDNVDEAKSIAEALDLPFEKVEGRVYYTAFLGKTVLKKRKLKCDRFTFQAITGFRDRNNGTWYGLVRAMKDPQRWANKWLSQTLHIMNSNAKGGLIMEEGAVDNPTSFEQSYAKPDQITWVPPGTLSSGSGPKLKEKAQVNFPSGFFQLMDFAIRSVRDVSGVNLEMLGMREANQPASLEYQRRQAGVTILAQLFRSMRRYHRSQGKVMLYYIQNHLSDGRLIKIVGDTGAQYVPLVKQADAKYDIIVDEGPTAPNQKERVWNLVGERFWDLPPSMQLIFLKYSPFPASVVAEIQKAAAEQEQSQGAMLEQQMQEFTTALEGAKVAVEQARAGLISSQSEESAAKAVKALAEAEGKGEQQGEDPEIQVAKIMADAKSQQERVMMDAEAAAAKIQAKMADDAGKRRIAEIKAAGDIKLRNAEIEGRQKIDAQKTAFDMGLKNRQQDFTESKGVAELALKQKQAEKPSGDND